MSAAPESTLQAHAAEKEVSSLISKRQLLDGQLKENELVLKELEVSESSLRVWKLIGDILVEKERSEALENVEKRIGFIRSELTKVDARLTQLGAKTGA